MTFGKTLQRIRRARGLNQRDVAKAMKMDFSYFSKLENDRFESKPTRETIDKISQALECNAEEHNELLASAGRATLEMEQVARAASENPEMGKSLGRLFRATVDMTPEQLDKWAERVERERRKLASKNEDTND